MKTKFTPGQSVTHVTESGSHFPATVHSVRGDKVKLIWPDGSTDWKTLDSCIIAKHDKRGAPKGNRNASKYGEPTVKRTLRLPVSVDKKLTALAKAAGDSQSAVVALMVTVECLRKD